MSAENGAGLLKQGYSGDEDESEEWQKIKGWVGSQEPIKKHPVQQLIEREARKVKGFADGGPVDDANAMDPDTMKLLQPQGAGIIAPGASPVPPMAPKPPVLAAPAPVTAPAAPIGAPPAAPAPSPASYDSEASKALGVNPDELKAFLTKTMTPTGGEMIGRAGSAIAQGISAAGGAPQNYLEQFDKETQQNKENLSGIPGKVAAAGKEQYGLAHELQTRDPASPYSKVIQNSNRPLLKSMGATDAEISLMSADAVNDVVGHQVELKKALAMIEQTGTYQRGLLDVQQQAQKTREAEANTREKEGEKGALEEVVKGSKIPFVGPSHTEKQAAAQKLGELGGLGAGPLGKETVRDGKTYEWSPTSGAYHLKRTNE